MSRGGRSMTSPAGAAESPDLSEFDKSEKESQGGQKLKVDVILEKLDEGRREKLLAALRGPYRHKAIARVLEDWGYPITGDSITKWRMKNRT